MHGFTTPAATAALRPISGPIDSLGSSPSTSTPGFRFAARVAVVMVLALIPAVIGGMTALAVTR